MKLMPQEVEVWYLIPAIRRELSRILREDYDLSQKRVSEILGLTESAVSQYIKEKRGGELRFNDSELKKIKYSANLIVNDEKNITKHLFKLSQELRGTNSLCELHKKHDSSIDKHCKICIGK